MKVEGELAQLGLGLNGQLTGHASFTPGDGKYPNAKFSVSGSDIGRAELKANRLDVQGLLTWPMLKLEKAQAQFADKSQAYFTGELDLEKKTVVTGKATINGPLGNRWLPEGFAYENVQISAEASGPLNSLTHSVHLTQPISLPRKYKCAGFKEHGMAKASVSPTLPWPRISWSTTWISEDLLESRILELNWFCGSFRCKARTSQSWL